HIAHAGTMNGLLAVTHADFERFGIRHKSIKAAIAEAAAAGLLVITEKGAPVRGGYGSLAHPLCAGLAAPA
ncbi:MAG: hypothetical protein WBE01_07035, partial [Methyloceanibacter sp.]